MKRYILPVLLFSVLLSACSSHPYKQTNKFYRKQAKELVKSLSDIPPVEGYGGKTAEYQIGTTNFNLRKPNYVIIHHTAQNSCDQTLKTFVLQRTQVSAHYVVCKDGTVHHMLNDYLRAWHAGAAKWGSLTDINSTSIGIELDNNGKEPFSESQINSLISLLEKLKKNYSIPTGNFIGHADIAPRRKPDPNAFFPWKKLAEHGFGYWPDMIVEVVPPGFNSINALRIIGYDTKDSVAAIKAFKLHFVQTDLSPRLTEADKGLLYNLSKKY
ncbi:N-acetylmuramoyl-L-alanine amidase [Arcticibacter tournemirensis]|uniref:N-acetylmuramoyl-L-alanine amidase n=1 Tax=Arcticibacter tournemirensis TaxID=699437 RepID=A0A5M9GWU6_9SPHI|nr:N-acetylmuramoyl-L-alanine amidase [Arcticibacter tournemirensis]KAA8479086.1 N-acetylmuramoyl-L-alanine amidase [Arcticibacter tournemirensis]TQM48661.1 N-acetylmuramoyl-L-alanine amidase [Arcticibacter tournemirensis]